MARGKGDSSRDADPTGWRRFYAFWRSPLSALTIIAVVLGTIGALLTGTISFDDDSGAARSSTPGAPSVPYSRGHAACSDRRDNDRDGKTDFGADPGCTSPADVTEKEPACSDGLDNDGDGKTDFGADPGCSAPADRAEKKGQPACSDGRDNDGDGKTDYGADPGCSAPTDVAEKEAACSDGRDNDGDGKTDFGADPECLSAADPAEKE